LNRTLPKAVEWWWSTCKSGGVMFGYIPFYFWGCNMPSRTTHILPPKLHSQNTETPKFMYKMCNICARFCARFLGITPMSVSGLCYQMGMIACGRMFLHISPYSFRPKYPGSLVASALFAIKIIFSARR
jgi:hypothetical protein